MKEAARRPVANGCAQKAPTMAQRLRDPDTSTYGGRVAARLRQLRLARGWSVAEICDRLGGLAGEPVKADTYRTYEKGTRAGGADLPVRLIPAVARAFGYATAHGWLPPS